MRRFLSLLALVGAVFALTAGPVDAGGYGGPGPIWCTVNTTGVPGGPFVHRIAIRGFWTDPVTKITAFGLSGYNVTTSANSDGYGYFPESGPPFAFAWTDSNTLTSATVRHWRFNVNGDLSANTRLTDITTTGNFTAIGVSLFDCQF